LLQIALQLVPFSFLVLTAKNTKNKVRKDLVLQAKV